MSQRIALAIINGRRSEIPESDTIRSADVYIKRSTTVNPGETSIIDAIPMTSLGAAEYSISASAGVNSRGFKMIVEKVNNGVYDQVYGRSGSLALEVATVVNGADMNLTLKNTGLIIMDVTLIRALL